MHNSFTSFLRGLYFIRFALTLWLIVLVLGPLDRFTSMASFTRGILTPESRWQAVTASFMVFSVGMIVLLLVRIIAVNGQERFECICSQKNEEETTERDSWLHSCFGAVTLPAQLFVVAHLAGVMLVFFVAFNMVHESAMALFPTIGFLALGFGAAYLFWLFVGLIYYWTFDTNSPHPVPRELVLPRGLIPLSVAAIVAIQTTDPPPLSEWLKLVFVQVARLGKGYADPRKPDHLYEAHRFAFLAFTGLTVLYIFFFSFTAPVFLPKAEIFSNTIACVAVSFVLAGCGLGKWPRMGAPRVVKAAAIALLSVVLFGLVYIWITHTHAPRGFSVLGSVLILITGILWLLASIAFACDVSRLPVLFVSLVFILLLKGCVPYRAEHYFSVVAQGQPFTPAPQPSQILDKQIDVVSGASTPAQLPVLIVITAEGGGIHSAAWTANVLTQLENTFRSTRNAPAFHSRILLASGVSGGSVGLLPFLREFTASQPFTAPSSTGENGVSGPSEDPVRARVTLAADCSSLQAIAWGLTYYDVLNFLSPIPILPAAGMVTSDTPPTGADRSWALERSLDRNLSDPNCRDDPQTLGTADPQLSDGYQMTLHSTAELLRVHRIPAFTFNTTAAETGGRFLLANYELPDEPLPPGILGSDFLPAESFLHAFGHENANVTPGTKPRSLNRLYADMPLATAARLSGTFPFVSSASRIPQAISTYGFHFIDGGYYDNDGTASAMEFLYYAVRNSKYFCEQVDCPQPRARLPILLIEIRNDPDLPSADNPDGFNAQDRPASPWGPDNQLLAPVEGFYNAGHVSDTLRNRRELCIFETAFRDRLTIHHMIFDYRNPEDKNQPLSWDLTPNQQHIIACALNPRTRACSVFSDEQQQESGSRSIVSLAQDAANWVATANTADLPDETCQNTGLGPK